MSDRIVTHHAESTTIVNAPVTSVATGLDAAEVIERLMARIEALTKAGDGLAENGHEVSNRGYKTGVISAWAAAVAAWKKAKE